MSSLSKFLSAVMVICAVFGSGYSSDVVLEFMPNDNYFVQCSNNSKLFNSTEELSNGMSSITNPYLCITSVEKSNDVITFNGVYNLEPCELKLSSTSECNPKLVFNFANNIVKFSKILINNSISSVDFNANVYDNIQICDLESNSSNVVVHTMGSILKVRNLHINKSSKFRAIPGVEVCKYIEPF